VSTCSISFGSSSKCMCVRLISKRGSCSFIFSLIVFHCQRPVLLILQGLETGEAYAATYSALRHPPQQELQPVKRRLHILGPASSASFCSSAVGEPIVACCAGHLNARRAKVDSIVAPNFMSVSEIIAFEEELADLLNILLGLITIGKDMLPAICWCEGWKKGK
jgi:hypothetical protein